MGYGGPVVCNTLSLCRCVVHYWAPVVGKWAHHGLFSKHPNELHWHSNQSYLNEPNTITIWLHYKRWAIHCLLFNTLLSIKLGTLHSVKGSYVGTLGRSSFQIQSTALHKSRRIVVYFSLDLPPVELIRSEAKQWAIKKNWSAFSEKQRFWIIYMFYCDFPHDVTLRAAAGAQVCARPQLSHSLTVCSTERAMGEQPQQF